MKDILCSLSKLSGNKYFLSTKMFPNMIKFPIHLISCYSSVFYISREAKLYKNIWPFLFIYTINSSNYVESGLQTFIIIISSTN